MSATIAVMARMKTRVSTWVGWKDKGTKLLGYFDDLEER
jgi:hypothetical protein